MRATPVRQVIRDEDAKIISVVDLHARNARQREALRRHADDALSRRDGNAITAYTMIVWR